VQQEVIQVKLFKANYTNVVNIDYPQTHELVVKKELKKGIVRLNTVVIYMNTINYQKSVVQASVATFLCLILILTSFFMFEPRIAHGITDVFTVRQQITSEISFKTAPNDVVMSPSIQGITGGTAYGTSTVAITTNSPAGYTMTIAFSTTTAMQGENITSDISNYTPTASGTPDFNFSVPAGSAEFGYTIDSVTTPGDIHARFKDSGAACNTGSGTLVGKCWYGNANATSPVTLISRTSATPGTGATSTIVFRVGVGATPVPALQTGFYTATATLTALAN
jgi:hypothetical protein